MSESKTRLSARAEAGVKPISKYSKEILLVLQAMTDNENQNNETSDAGQLYTTR